LASDHITVGHKEKTLHGNIDVGPQVQLKLSHKEVNNPNAPRPPDKLSTPLLGVAISEKLDGNNTLDSEEFIDAKDEGILGSTDSEMEVVEETPIPAH
jgi:hypothetical protein